MYTQILENGKILVHPRARVGRARGSLSLSLSLLEYSRVPLGTVDTSGTYVPARDVMIRNLSNENGSHIPT